MFVCDYIQRTLLLFLTATNKYTIMAYNAVADRMESVVLYTVEHRIDSPCRKTYTLAWMPHVRVTIDYNNLLDVGVGARWRSKDNTNPTGRFFHNCAIHKRALCYFIASVPGMKPLSDYTQMQHIGMSVQDGDRSVDASHVMSRMYSCIPLTASRVCAFFGLPCEGDVHVIDSDCDEITFKGTDCVN